jgi:hypothetical protein
MPRLLRSLFRRRRELLLDLAQCAAEAIAEYTRREVAEQARSGIVASIATSGDLMQWHPHGHLLVTDGAFSDDGAFHTIASWNAEAVMTLFRERLLARLIERHAISEAAARFEDDRRPSGGRAEAPHVQLVAADVDQRPGGGTGPRELLVDRAALGEEGEHGRAVGLAAE